MTWAHKDEDAKFFAYAPNAGTGALFYAVNDMYMTCNIYCSQSGG